MIVGASIIGACLLFVGAGVFYAGHKARSTDVTVVDDITEGNDDV